MPFTRGFRGRRGKEAETGRVPPGQYVTQDFPVRSAGPTPHHPIGWWSLEVRGEIDEPRVWTWEEFTALPSERVTADIHCVTRWRRAEPSRSKYRISQSRAPANSIAIVDWKNCTGRSTAKQYRPPPVDRVQDLIPPGRVSTSRQSRSRRP